MVLLGVDAEWQVLETEEGQTLLQEVSSILRPGPSDLTRWRKQARAEVVSAAVRLAEARRKGANKFDRAEQMWLDPIGLEQATAEPVARHKALRFQNATVVVDLCSGIGGDAIAQAGFCQRVLAVDVDSAMSRRVRYNAEVYEVGERLRPIQARAETFPIPAEALIHIDPDRRAGPRRARSIEGYVPGPNFLKELAKFTKGGAIKLSPASNFDDSFSGPDFEIELISLQGECKEATAWFGTLKTCQKRVSVISSRTIVESWTDQDGPTEARAGVQPLGRLIFDPDPALCRSGLLDSYALVHQLGRVAPGIDFLTGDKPIASRLLTSFEVVEVLPMDQKQLRRMVQQRGLGPLEIKPRGLSIRPEDLRTRLRPPGPNPATILLVGGSEPAKAIVARRCI